MEISTCYYNTQTPLGWLEMKAGLNGLTSAQFVAHPGIDTGSNYYLDMAMTQLREYFAGRRREFTVPVAPEGTEFEMLVWNKVSTIPFGANSSYGRIARQIGKASAVRAVGGANGKNPIAIFIPCHRVVGENGSLTGYAWGMERKKWLLDWEKRDVEPKLFKVPASGTGIYR